MGEKSVQKQQFIVEAARKVFADKGFIDVTMKDIVEACDISRGGLYLYFASTEEVFTEVLKLEQQAVEPSLEEVDMEDEEVTPSDILALFLKEQKREILRRKNSLTVAIYEYLFHHKVARPENVMKQQFETAVMIIEKLIEAGITSGEFYCEYPRETARNMMYVIEGLKIMAHTSGLSEAAIDREFLFLMQGLVYEE